MECRIKTTCSLSNKTQEYSNKGALVHKASKIQRDCTKDKHSCDFNLFAVSPL